MYTTVEAAKVATQAKVDALYAKTERNAIKIQHAKEESLRLQTTELEAKLEMQRSLAEHQTVVQNRFQSKRFDVYKLNALKQDKAKRQHVLYQNPEYEEMWAPEQGPSLDVSRSAPPPSSGNLSARAPEGATRRRGPELSGHARLEPKRL